MNHILLVAATPFEIAPTLSYLQENWAPHPSSAKEVGKNRTSAGQQIDLNAPVYARGSNDQEQEQTLFHKGETELKVLISGVGLTATAFALGRASNTNPYRLAIQAGIGGAIDRSLALGQLVRVASDRFADLGAEDQDGSLINLQELGFMPEGSNSPFNPDGTLSPMDEKSQASLIDLPYVAGISVNKVHGSTTSIERLREKYPTAQVESMEGAAFFYACNVMGWPALQLRSISNYVEARDKANWTIKEAIASLNEGLIRLLDVLA
ncbi:MAG: futalosine hydrolase [Bacteroidota bacterium]